MKKIYNINILKLFFVTLNLIFLSISCKKKDIEPLKRIDNSNKSFSELVFPDTIINNHLFGHFKYRFKLHDTIKNDPDDTRIMKVYTKFTKKRINPERINIKECDSFFAMNYNLIDTLKVPIFYSMKNLKGPYYLSGKVIVTSIPQYYGKKDSTNQIMLIREFSFMKNDSIIIN